jgi:acetyl esterase/lipase
MERLLRGSQIRQKAKIMRMLVLQRGGMNLAHLCQRWAAALGVEVETRRCPDEAAILASIRSAGDAEGIVLVPGLEGFASAALASAVADVEAPVVAVDLGNLRRRGAEPAASMLALAGARVIHGRGVDGCRWGLHHVVWRASWPSLTVAYGDLPDQVGDLRLPGHSQPYPVAVLVHGGYWYEPWERDLMDGLAVDLVRRGWATWTPEYRRVGAGGGWPTTAHDLAAAVEHVAALAAEHPLDVGRVILLGHSAGGQLVLWAAVRRQARIRPRLVVALAPVADLAAARGEGPGSGPVGALLATADDPQRALAEASPIMRVPLGVTQLVAHTADDALVPVTQSRRYVAAARAADDRVTYHEFAHGGHFALITPGSPAWRATVDALEEHCQREG